MLRVVGLRLGIALSGPPPLTFEVSARSEDGRFHAFPSLEPSEPNTPEPRSAFRERSAPTTFMGVSGTLPLADSADGT